MRDKRKMLSSVKISLAAFLLAASLAGSVGIGCPVGDLSGNCKVDLEDLGIFAQRWLDPNCLVPGCQTDLDGTDGVNMTDFALLAGNWQEEGIRLVISEFMARNSSTLFDANYESSDWLEIYNPTGEAINLEGWYLTDNDANLTKWRFPSVEVDSGEFLVVFASGKDREYPNELHTNFKLDGDGEYLALVAADGNTITHEYAPAYPDQLTDISYGLAQHAITVVPTGATAFYHVPMASDAGTDWTAIDFNDLQWDTGRTALGFAAQPDVTAGDIGGAAPAGTYSANGNGYTVSGSGDDIWGSSDSFYYVYLPLVGDGEISARVVSMTNTHSWAKCGVMIREGLEPGSKNAYCYMTSEYGKSIQNRRQTNDRSWHSNSEGYSVPYWVRLMRQGDTFSYYHSDDGIDWVLQPGSGEMSNPVTIPMNQSAYIGLAVTSHANGQLCTAVFDNVTFGDEVANDLAEAMLGNSCSLWTRIRFDLDEDEPEMFESLVLRIKYEDGFAAYLNGQKIAWANAADFLAWDSAALSNRPVEASSVFESIDLRDYRHLLRPGTNVLAVHGLNDDKDDEDFLILPELTAASGVGAQQYFTMPTPYVHNVSGAKGLVGKVRFSHKRGFYNSPFDLTLSTESGDADIRYTFDGSTPTITNGNLYDPLLRPRVNATSTVRAAAFTPGYLTPQVETHTYIFPADVAAQSTMSTAITADPTWGPQIEDALLEVPTISLVTPHSISEAERETSVEMIFPDGAEGFQVDAGVEHFGGHSLGYPKNNMRISFKSMYGPTKLKFDLFDGVLFGEGATDEFDQFLLRTGSHDTMFWTQPSTNARGTYIRNRWIMDRQLESGQPAPRGRFVHVYINGVYWGLHHLMERPNAAFMASYFGDDKTDYDSVKGDWGVLKALSGDLNAWNSMEGSTGDYAAVRQYIDVVNYADYMVLNFYAGNDWDWNHCQNWMVGRKRRGGDGFKFFCWDNDVILRTQPNANVVNRGGPGNMWGAMKQHEEFKVLVADHAHKFLFNDGMLTRDSVLAQIDDLAERIERLIIPECARWGIPQNYTPTTWRQSVDWIKNTIVQQRTETVIQQVRDAGVFPNIDGPVFSPGGGYVQAGQMLSMTAGAGTIYYSLDGNDVRVSMDIGAAGSISASAVEYTGPIPLNSTAHVKARALSGSTWSAVNEAVYSVGPVAESLRITEIMFHPQDTGGPNDPNAEYVELKNIAVRPININLAAFTNGIDFTFSNTIVPAGGLVVVVKNRAAFDAQYPAFTGVIAGEYAGRLDNAGERIELEDALGQSILNFRYSDGWRSITDGLGHSLTIIDPSNPDPNSWGQQDSWRASAYVGGSAGYDDSGAIPNPGEVVINEILAHSHGAEADWIELHNTTGAQIDIGGWYLSDSEVLLKKYQLAAGTKIDAHDYLVLYEDANFGDSSSDPGKIMGFAFSENGDQAYLSSAEAGVLTGYRAVEDFGASQTGISFGRYYKSSTDSYNFVPMDHNTPDAANAYPKIGPIVISEIMYNPDWPVGGMYANDSYEFIELCNITSSPVKLYRDDKALPWRFSDGIDFIFGDAPDEVTIAADDYIVVVKDVDAFMWRYPSVPAEKIFGPYDGKLSNGGERVEISMPGDTDIFGRQYYIRIDRVNYSDGSHHEDAPGGIDLWPTEPDGGGKSLSRTTPELYGNDPNNWTAQSPTPAAANP